MNYKSIFQSRDTRVKILQLLSFIPDKQMLQLQYRIKMGRKLNLKDPKRYTEKLQWYKLNYRDPLMAQCADKYDVREYVRECGLGDILIPDYGVYDSVQDIDWEKLPNAFALKDTLGGGGNSVIICEDKSALEKESLYRQLNRWTKISAKTKSSGREWVYEGKRHRIYIEELLSSDEESGGLIDYKFFCFNGNAKYLYVIADRKLGDDAEYGIYDNEFRKLDVMRCGERKLTREVARPKNYRELKSIAEKLSSPFPHARVDLYDVDEQIFFGEITFFGASGYMTFDPDSFDFELGEAFDLPKSGGGGHELNVKPQILNLSVCCTFYDDAEVAA